MRLPATAYTILALAFAAGAGPSWATPEKAVAFYENALKRYEAGDNAGAIVQLKNAVQQDNNSLASHLLLGRALYRQGAIKAAEASFEEALRLGVNRGEIAVELGRVYLLLGSPQKFLDRFPPAGLPPAIRAQVLSLRGVAQFDLGDPREAARSFEEARAADPSSPTPWIDEIPMLLAANQLDRAMVAAERAIKLGPGEAAAWNVYASTMQAARNLKAALTGYDRALSIDGGLTDARAARAGLLVDLGRDADAEKDLEILAKTAPGDPRASYMRALLATKRGDTAAVKREMSSMAQMLDAMPSELLHRREQLMMLAILANNAIGNRQRSRDLLEVVLLKNPANNMARKLLASNYLGSPERARAEPLLLALHKALPNDPQVLYMLGTFHLSERRYAQATQMLERAAARLDDPDVRSALAASQLGLGNESQGLATLEKAAAAKPDDASLGLQVVMQHVRRGDNQKALAAAEGVVKRAPGNLTALNMLGAVRLSVGNRAGAREVFEQALQKDPAFRPAMLNLAKIDAAEGKFDEGRRRLVAMTTQNTGDADAVYELGMLEQRAGRPGEAERHFRKAIDQSRSDMRAGLALVELLARQRRWADSAEAAKALAARFPDSLSALRTLARAQIGVGDLTGARNALQAATKLAEFNPVQQVAIGRLQLLAGNPDGAAYNVQKALQGVPDDLGAMALAVDAELHRKDFARADAAQKALSSKYPAAVETHLGAAAVAMARGQFPAAVVAFRQALGKQENVPIVLGLAQAHVAAGEEAKARAVLDGWVKRKPDDLVVVRALAELQHRAGDLRAARGTYAQVVAKSPQDGAVLNNYANLLRELGDPSAQEMAERALKTDPQSAEFTDTLGWILVQQGKVDEGVRYLREARLRNPASQEIRYHLAWALAKSGKIEEAKREAVALALPPGQRGLGADVAKLKRELGI